MRIRPAVAADEPFILGLAPRLVEFGRVAGREPSEMIARDRAVLTNALEHPSGDSSIFIAEDGNTPLGFIHLTTTEDYYTAGDAAHIADVVVAPDAGERGIGTALIAYAERWAIERGFSMVTLNVFAANRRARDLYTKLGFQEEWIRCIKRLSAGVRRRGPGS